MNKLNKACLTLFMLYAMTGCLPDSTDLELGTPLSADQVTFTMTPIEGEVNKYLLTNTTPNAFITLWKIGTGSYKPGKGFLTDTAFFKQKGDYEIQLQTTTATGTFSSNSQTLMVAEDAPDPPIEILKNLVEGGDMSDPTKWNTIVILEGATYAINNGKMVATIDSDVPLDDDGNIPEQTIGAAFYQAVEVEANTDYKFSAVVSGGPAHQVFHQLFFEKTEPTEGTDIPEAKTKLQINTWAGCGTDAFNGDFVELSCGEVNPLKDTKGIISFTEAGTYYLTIKTGSWKGRFGSTGIAVDDVVFGKVKK